MSRLLVAALLGALSLSACAQPATPAASQKPAAAPASAAKAGTAEAAVRAALQTVAPGMEAEYVGDAPFPGFREVLLGGQLLYVSDDGRYLFQSQPFDLQQLRPATSAALMAHRRTTLEKIPVADRIVFAPANPKHTITVFTDIECGYCRRMHQQIADYNRLGIAVQYVAFPRMGPGSQDFTDMESVWCAGDRRRALSAAKAGQPVTQAQCQNPVAAQFEIGRQVGVNGTPAVFAADGTQLGGYVAPQDLLKVLDALEGQSGARGGAR